LTWNLCHPLNQLPAQSPLPVGEVGLKGRVRDQSYEHSSDVFPLTLILSRREKETGSARRPSSYLWTTSKSDQDICAVPDLIRDLRSTCHEAPAQGRGGNEGQRCSVQFSAVTPDAAERRSGVYSLAEKVL